MSVVVRVPLVLVRHIICTISDDAPCDLRPRRRS
jgi:hypothetical protein